MGNSRSQIAHLSAVAWRRRRLKYRISQIEHFYLNEGLSDIRKSICVTLCPLRLLVQ
jgi:hypothetical protein